MKTVSFTTRLLALQLCLAAQLCVFASCKSNIRGEGSTGFTLTVTQKDGSSEEFEIRTDKDNVGDALLDAGMITGSTSEYGLFIESVNGVAADFEKDKTYWALYVDGEYSMVGISSVKVRSGMKIGLKMEVYQES